MQVRTRAHEGCRGARDGKAQATVNGKMPSTIEQGTDQRVANQRHAACTIGFWRLSTSHRHAARAAAPARGAHAHVDALPYDHHCNEGQTDFTWPHSPANPPRMHPGRVPRRSLPSSGRPVKGRTSRDFLKPVMRATPAHSASSARAQPEPPRRSVRALNVNALAAPPGVLPHLENFVHRLPTAPAAPSRSHGRRDAPAPNQRGGGVCRGIRRDGAGKTRPAEVERRVQHGDANQRHALHHALVG